MYILDQCKMTKLKKKVTMQPKTRPKTEIISHRLGFWESKISWNCCYTFIIVNFYI
jgi:hypothetical protein